LNELETILDNEYFSISLISLKLAICFQMTDFKDYSLFHRFIETYLPTGFKGIDRDDTLLKQLEAITEANKQFFHVANLIQAKITWSSRRSEQMIGISPEELDAYHFMEATHPDDLEKHTCGRSKMFDTANDLFVAKKGRTLLSINIRLRNNLGEYPDLLFQLYFMYSEKFNTVFLFQVHTDIDSFKKRKHGYHYYVGTDFSNFRYPDEELLAIGIPLSDREFEIVRLIESGLDSEEIAEKLFLSVHTVNTHRRNILKKTSRETIAELIYDFKEKRLL
jgi:DNA-binding CsgD family transcriptional regulator